MRLNQIKLHGFKSFVDPTTINFPSNLVGVVGPNGCGKSNVIDAIRWVMGESSAKTLRGSAMLDVIFNGSRSRSPAEYAEIELVFADVDLPQYPDMPQLSVKRRLTQKNQSIYFLNGERCRRKDVTHIFLGTGLGPRSYAIIEQGMISRFIEAKPDDLRVFLEEAAGISKYKEKRRETELRIKHSRDNMERLTDIETELEKQLKKLQRQVKTAEKYQVLKQKEQQYRTELFAMRWQSFHENAQQQQQRIDIQEQKIQQQAGTLAELIEQQQQERQAHSSANISFNQIQTNYYKQQTQLEKLAQSISHNQEKQQQLDLDLDNTQNALDETRATLAADQERLSSVKIDNELLSVESDTLTEQMQTVQQQYYLAEADHQHSQQQWEQFSQSLHQPAQQMQVEQTHIQNLQQRIQGYQDRLQRLSLEQEKISPDSLQAEIEQLNEQLSEDEETTLQHYESLESLQQEIESQKTANQNTQKTLHQQHQQQQQQQGRLAALESLQQASLGKDQNNNQAWLQQQGIEADSLRLAEKLKVDPKWETALETVLKNYLDAYCVDDLDKITQQLKEQPAAKLCLIETAQSAQANPKSKAETLISKINSDFALGALLNGIYVADDLDQAYRLHAQLAANESIITAQGHWLGKHWLSLNAKDQQNSGIFAREQAIQALQTELHHSEQAIEQLEQQQQQGELLQQQKEQQQQQIQLQLNQQQQQRAQLQAELSAQQVRLEQQQQRQSQVREEQEEIAESLENDQMDLETAQENYLLAEAEHQSLLAEQESLEQQRHEHQSILQTIRQQWQTQKDQQHQVQLRYQQKQSEQQHLEQSLERLQEQIEQLQEKHYDLSLHQQQLQQPEQLETEYTQAEQIHQQLAEQRQEAEQNVKQYEAKLKQIERQQQQIETDMGEQRAHLEQAKLDYQSNLIRRQTIEEQLAEEKDALGHSQEWDLTQILADLSTDADEQSWQIEIEDIERKLLRLGSINMAALEEYQQEADRHQNLVTQQQDLEQALAMLEQAINTIDKETRKRLTRTLEQVNSGFQRLFPILFGGGQAGLQLLGEDILNSGIAVMARPPGKRNSSIHLLSGGEKALTAVALVFAIFELNPAPFCLLDEVDAPLDDSNVSRFCRLVTEMSKQVQFIFISHNKVAMEMAQQLIGITMQEAGVSRSVAVDVDLAVEMANS